MLSAQKFVIKAIRKTLLSILPLDKRLPLRYQAALSLGECESELRHLQRVIPSVGSAIDVGANAGMYSYKLSQHFEKVFAFEINADLTQELSACNPGNIEIVHKGLSSDVDSATLYIPIYQGHPLTGWASLQPGNCPVAQDHLEKPVEVCRLDDFQLDTVSFIKIDVEGHEVEVLKGAYDTIKTHRPHLLIEVREENFERVSDFFAPLHYRTCQLHDLVGVPGSEGNYFFIPA